MIESARVLAEQNNNPGAYITLVNVEEEPVLRNVPTVERISGVLQRQEPPVHLNLYVLFSFRQRFIELGVLRAAGLSMGQMSGYMAWELTFLILLGVALGTGLGVLASRLFIPFLQIGSRLSALVPPFQVLIAWPAIFQIYGMLVLLFGVTLVILLASLRGMKIFQAIKLGETV